MSAVPRLEAHYDALVEEHGYSRIDFDLGEASASSLRRRFVAVDGRKAVATAFERSTVVATGVGMTGPPHLGTVGQMLTAIELQSIGLDVQFVIADLEPYHAGADLAEIRKLAARYRSFVTDLGFEPDQGVLRTQTEAREVMQTAHLLARYYTPEEGGYWPDTEPTAWESAVETMYEELSPLDDVAASSPTSEAASAHNAVLHMADFLHPLIQGDDEQVTVLLGIDEHALTIGTRRFAADAGVPGTVAGLHTRMITGVGDYPKMSKSVPRSSISLDMPPAEIREHIVHREPDAVRPADSPVVQMMRLASPYTDERLAELEVARAEGGERWQAAKCRYAEYVIDLAEKWKQTETIESPDSLSESLG